MRRIVLTLAATAVLVTPVALAQAVYPEKIPLPNGFAPEGIAIGTGNTFYVGSIPTGAIFRGNLRTGTGTIFIPGAAGQRAATGLEYDRGRLWVSGAGTGKAFVYNARTGALIREYQLGTPPATFINDVVVTKRAAYFTDSQQPVVYKVALSKNGAPGTLSSIQLTGAYTHLAGQFNLNGIDAAPSGKRLLTVQTATGKLFLLNPQTGGTTLVDLGGYVLQNGDGILLHGRTLYVVQNLSDKIAVLRLTPSLTRGTLARTIEDDDFDVPTTIDRLGSRIYAVNARFGRTTPTDQAYDVVKAG
jgi:sugar lactone lactonase YvrE